MKQMRWAAVFLLPLVLPIDLIAGDVGPGSDFALRSQQVRALLDRCQDHLYNKEYEKAETCFDTYIKRYPEDPIGYWRKLNTIYVKIRSARKKQGKTDEPKLEGKKGEKDDVMYAKIMTLCDVGIEKTEVKLHSVEDEENNKDFYLYVKESILGFKALFQFANGAPWSAKENAEIMLSLSMVSKYPDAPAPAGLLEYEISRRSIFVRIGAKVLGLPADRKHGLELLAKAFHGNNSYFSDDVRFVIFGILTEKSLKSKDRENAEKILGVSVRELLADLKARYPRNSGLVAP